MVYFEIESTRGAPILAAILLIVSSSLIRASDTSQANVSEQISVTTTYVFVCADGNRVVVRAEEGFAWVFIHAGTLRLPAVLAVAGTAYSDNRFELHIDGEYAHLGPHGALQACRNDQRAATWERAKLEGADFRAVGNEPGWNLEIRGGDRAILITDYGATRIEIPLPKPLVDAKNRMTRWDSGDMVVEVRGYPCRDDMSGEQFGAQVKVTWRGRTFSGCGRALH